MGVDYSAGCSSVNRKKFRANYNVRCHHPDVFRGDRLAELMRGAGISQSELARRIDVSQATIWKLVQQPAQGSKHTHRIARELGTTAEYLMGETDDPAGDAPAERRLPAASVGDVVEIDELDVAFGMGATYLDVEPERGIKIQFSRSWLRHFTESSPEHLFSATGIGDSMYPTIHDRDLVLVDRAQRTIHQGDQIWAVAYGHTGMIKRLRSMPDGSIKIMSDNAQVPPEIAYDGELHIIGRVVAIVRKL